MAYRTFETFKDLALQGTTFKPIPVGSPHGSGIRKQQEASPLSLCSMWSSDYGFKGIRGCGGEFTFGGPPVTRPTCSPAQARRAGY